MLADISSVDAIYIVCGRTDMRKSIDGLCAIIQEQFSMEIDHALFLFCGRKCDRIKAILKEPDGIVMIYKRLTAQGSYRWPRNKSEVRCHIGVRPQCGQLKPRMLKIQRFWAYILDFFI